MKFIEILNVIFAVFICLFVILFLYLIFNFGILIALNYIIPIFGIIVGFFSISGIGTLITLATSYVNKLIELQKLSQEWIELTSKDIDNAIYDKNTKKRNN